MNQERGGLAGARAGVERGARGGAGRDGSPPLYSEVGAVDGGGSCARGGPPTALSDVAGLFCLVFVL